MIKDLVTIHKKNKLGDVLNKMKTCNIKCLIVAEDNKPIGIITRSNLLHVFLEQLSKQQ